MGCGASTPVAKPITLEQITSMCNDACMRMEIICIKKALENPEDFKILPPPEVQDLKKSAESLHKAAKDASAPAEKAAGGGMLGSVMGAVKDAAGAASGAGLTAMAQLLDGISADLTKPFETVAQDVVTAKKDELYNVFVAYINDFKFAEPVKICRGDAPWNAESYKTVPFCAISTALISLAKADLCAKLEPIVKDSLQNHAVTKAWQGAIGTFNQAYDAISNVIKVEDLTAAGVKKCECDLPKCITVAIVNKLEEIMAREEGLVRDSPAGRDICYLPTQKPISFAKIFSVEPLFDSDYQFWKDGVQGTPKPA